MKIFTFLLGMIPMLAFAQQVSPDNVKESWNVIHQEGDVVIYASKILCDFNQGFDDHSILLKVENNSSNEVEVSWKTDLYFDGVCTNCNFSEEDSYVFTLKANSSIEGVCERESGNSLRIATGFEGYKTKQTFTGFELNNIKTVEK